MFNNVFAVLSVYNIFYLNMIILFFHQFIFLCQSHVVGKIKVLKKKLFIVCLKMFITPENNNVVGTSNITIDLFDLVILFFPMTFDFVGFCKTYFVR